MAKRIIIILLLCLTGKPCWAQDYRKVLSEIIQSEMARHPKAWTIDGNTRPRWNYAQGLEVMAITDAADALEKDAQGPLHNQVYAFALTYADTLIQEGGSILNYKMENYSLDEVNSGKILYRLWQRTGQQKYQQAMDTLRKHLKQQPRVPEGGFWHKQRYPQQMWLDGLYMGAPYYAEYASRFETGSEQEASFQDIWHQFRLCFEKTWCDKCQLLHHGWDSSHQQKWCDKQTGQSAHAWGRAEGWYLMALVDCMDWMPEMYKDSLGQQLRTICKRLVKIQDKKNGCWMQVLDETGREGNYYEMSATAMFAYTMLKGYRLGVLDKKYRKAGLKALNGILKHYLTTDEHGMTTLHNICHVAGLSDDRDGSYEYYISTEQQDNDPKGVGPLIKATIEELRIKN